MERAPMLFPTHFPTLILSDVHLGSFGCRADEANRLLAHCTCDTLILNGDIIDAWALRRGGKWRPAHTDFIHQILTKVRQGTRVIYVRGNHDDVLDQFLPLSLAGIEFTDRLTLQTPQGEYLVVHGDVFDTITTDFKFLAKIGDVGYTLLLKYNRWYNRRRQRRGLPYKSVSQGVKARVKVAVNFVSSFEDTLVQIARAEGYRGVICGHIHTPADKMVEDVHYLNSGDWVETLSALVQDAEGRFRVLYYTDFESQLNLLEQTRRAMAQELVAEFAQAAPQRQAAFTDYRHIRLETQTAAARTSQHELAYA